MSEVIKDRLDKILVDLGYFETKSKAQAAIMAGDVKVDGEKITKSGKIMKFTDNTAVEIKSAPYVSRGGFKLEKAIKEFNIDLTDVICFDAGASTGGFTDCMLQNGAKYVYAVDVGYGQIAWKLRSSDKVKVIERTNVKNCEYGEIYSETDEIASFASADLSFISINKVLENLVKLLSNKPQILALIKPQFEAGRESIGKNGVVRSKDVHFEVITRIIEHSNTLGLFPQNLTYSPIKGPAGNIEYLIYLTKEENSINSDKIMDVINSGFEKLNENQS